MTQDKLKVEQVDMLVADEIVSAANIVTVGGYYEADIDKVAAIVARHRLSARKAAMIEAAGIAKAAAARLEKKRRECDDSDYRACYLWARQTAEALETAIRQASEASQ